MCFLQPLKVKQIRGSTYELENGIEAICDANLKNIRVNDAVLVYGNLIISKVSKHEKSK